MWQKSHTGMDLILIKAIFWDGLNFLQMDLKLKLSSPNQQCYFPNPWFLGAEGKNFFLISVLCSCTNSYTKPKAPGSNLSPLLCILSQENFTLAGVTGQVESQIRFYCMGTVEYQQSWNPEQVLLADLSQGTNNQSFLCFPNPLPMAVVHLWLHITAGRLNYWVGKPCCLRGMC